jgi:hypothetical protein
MSLTSQIKDLEKELDGLRRKVSMTSAEQQRAAHIQSSITNLQNKQKVWQSIFDTTRSIPGIGSGIGGLQQNISGFRGLTNNLLSPLRRFGMMPGGLGSAGMAAGFTAALVGYTSRALQTMSEMRTERDRVRLQALDPSLNRTRRLQLEEDLERFRANKMMGMFGMDLENNPIVRLRDAAIQETKHKTEWEELVRENQIGNKNLNIQDRASQLLEGKSNAFERWVAWYRGEKDPAIARSEEAIKASKQYESEAIRLASLGALVATRKGMKSAQGQLNASEAAFTGLAQTTDAQALFESIELSRIARRNFARSLMGRAGPRTGD